MTRSDLELLRANIDSTVQLAFADGEVVSAKIVSVSEEEGDVIYDIAKSNRRDKYPDGYDKAAYLAHFEEIVSVSKIEN